MSGAAALFKLLSVQRPHGDAQRIEILEFESIKGVYVGKDVDGKPMLLVASHESDAQFPSFELEHLQVAFGIRCRTIDAGDELREIRCCVFRCKSGDLEFQRYFLDVCDVVAAILRSDGLSAIRVVADRLIQLFQKMAMPPRKSLQGFWAEVFLISESKEPAALIDAWHVLPTDKFDFARGAERIEVKSSSLRRRLHNFSSEQLNPPAGASAVVASVFVERAGHGASIRDLLSSIKARIPGDGSLHWKLESFCAETLGSAYRVAIDEKFDLELAKESLQFYLATAVPKLSPPYPQGISSVRFEANLEGVDYFRKLEEGHPFGFAFLQ